LPFDSDTAIKIENLWIRYRTTVEAQPTLKSTVIRLGRRETRRRQVRVVEAVQDFNLQVRHGSVLGVIGANGAGKSTLLRAVAGILPPTEGRITVAGRVSTLLALGVGFNGLLSGRENIVLGCLAAGLSREEIEDRYEQIADFADLGEFIDMPMRTYSSGMYSRLAFSVSIHMDPDILLIDEALSTGDAAFKDRSFAKMEELVKQARTIVIVSHALGTVKDLCTEAVWMHKGRLMQQGNPDEVGDAYLRFLKVGATATAMEDV
jgi:ABC-2 type transport system ATP-binding protein/teichoic acid transport system ATP-binding protein